MVESLPSKQVVAGSSPVSRSTKLTVVAAFRLLLDAANGTPYYLGVFTAVYTGLRRGEMLALRWCDVDLDLATLMPRSCCGREFIQRSSPSA